MFDFSNAYSPTQYLLDQDLVAHETQTLFRL
jgi:hypothetical protein